MEPTLDFASVRSDIAAHLYLEGDQLAETEDLFAAGLDSLRLLGLVEHWRAQGAQISFADLAEQPTLQAWWALLSRQRPASD